MTDAHQEQTKRLIRRPATAAPPPTAATLLSALSAGMRMRDLFAAAKAASAMSLSEVSLLFEQPSYEARLSACCVLDFRARSSRTTAEERAQLYEMYLSHHDSIDTWDMVDRSAPSVVGGFLLGRSKQPLHDLARAADPVRRRTAITAPLWFVRFGSADDLAEVFPIATILVADGDPLVHKAVGIALKHAGGRDGPAVSAFLERHITAMPRAAARLATEKLPAAERERLLRRR